MKCETCGNDYDKTFEVTLDGTRHVFDSFACAIHALAPRCAHCGVKIIGHGLETSNRFYCCAHCARHDGQEELRDRVGAQALPAA
ncbi:MAG TPA: hypothetical protein VHE35_07875 [Kofleriaceae bacterium]|nr:hypothetical protein [Kofleriaceae bacterium]